MQKKRITSFIAALIIIMGLFVLSACGFTDNNQNGAAASDACQIISADENFVLEDKELTGTVPKSASWINFADIITVSENAQFKVYADFEGRTELAAKRAYIPDEENIFYIVVTAQSGKICVYTVNVLKVDTVNISFNAMGGTIDGESVKLLEVIEGRKVTPPEAQYEGYTFTGWYDNAAYEGASVDFENYTAVSEITFFAKWEKNPETPAAVNITFNANGGNFVIDDENAETFMLQVQKGSIIDSGDILIPVKEGEVFAGWHIMAADGITLGEEIDLAEYVIEEETVFYAVYSAS